MAIQILYDILIIFKILLCIIFVAASAGGGFLAGNTIGRWLARWRRMEDGEPEKVKNLLHILRGIGAGTAGAIAAFGGEWRVLALGMGNQTMNAAIALFAETAVEGALMSWVVAGLGAAAYCLVDKISRRNSSTGSSTYIPLSVPAK